MARNSASAVSVPTSSTSHHISQLCVSLINPYIDVFLKSTAAVVNQAQSPFSFFVLSFHTNFHSVGCPRRPRCCAVSKKVLIMLNLNPNHQIMQGHPLTLIPAVHHKTPTTMAC